MARQNKKILCFIDECGTAGHGEFSLGCVMVWARDTGRIDKALSDLLEPSANELHAANLNNQYIMTLLGRFAQTDKPDGLLLLSRMGTANQGSAPEQYASDVIETVKVAIGQFKNDNGLGGRGVGNVDLILDVNHQNSHADFGGRMEDARRSDGRFRAVSRISQINSAASRTLQLADLVAYSRRLVHRDEMTVKSLRQNFGIRVLCIRKTARRRSLRAACNRAL